MRAKIPALDGLRGAACLLVLMGHYIASNPGPDVSPVLGRVFSQYWSGVDLFFVLSGFVIFLSLHRLEERTGRGRAFLFSFVSLRAFRVLPVYLLLVLSYLLIPVLFPRLAGAPPFASSIPDWCYFVFGQSLWGVAHQRAGADYMNVTWSLCAEVFFYGLAFLMVLVVPRARRIPVLGALVLASYACRIYFVFAAGDQAAAYLIPVCRMDGFMMGGIAATLYVGGRLPLADTRVIDVVLLPLVLVYGLLAYAQNLQASMFSIFFSYTFYSGFYCLVLIRVLSGRWTALASGPLALFGTISYFVYLFQVPALWLVETNLTGALPRFVATVGLLVAAGTFSWIMLERPLIRLGRSLTAAGTG
jgi:peptidoglycan/LPS O-acetylase OafA/YrhL